MFMDSKMRWTDDDFAQMQWGGIVAYAFAIDAKNFEFLIDIDYVVSETRSSLNGPTMYAVAPATLAFENVNQLIFDLDGSSGVEIRNISRANPGVPKNSDYVDNRQEWEWTIDCLTGTVAFRSVGYVMYIRSIPETVDGLSLGLERRGGFGFGR